MRIFEIIKESQEQLTSPVVSKTTDGSDIFWVEMFHKNPARSRDGIGRPDNGPEGRSVGYVIRDDHGIWRHMTSNIGQCPYDFYNQHHPAKMTADQVFQQMKKDLSQGGTQIKPIAGYPGSLSH